MIRLKIEAQALVWSIFESLSVAMLSPALNAGSPELLVAQHSALSSFPFLIFSAQRWRNSARRFIDLFKPYFKFWLGSALAKLVVVKSQSLRTMLLLTSLLLVCDPVYLLEIRHNVFCSVNGDWRCLAILRVANKILVWNFYFSYYVWILYCL